MKKILSHLNLPSPVSEVRTSWSEKSGIRLLIKRDDLIHPFISGNKWRKLSGIFKYYSSEKYQAVRTYGGAYSNHLLATACACSILQIPVSGVVRGEVSASLNPVLRLCRTFGMQLTYCDRERFREEKHKQGLDQGLLHIPEGGACKAGLEGCREILNEVDDLPDHVFLACGTGTTLAGMVQAKHKNGHHYSITGVPVLKGGEFIATAVRELTGLDDFDLLTNYHFGGYAKSNPELITFTEEFCAETGVLLDPVYTSKMTYALYNQCIKEKIEEGSTVMLIHSGGLSGWFGKYMVLEK